MWRWKIKKNRCRDSRQELTSFLSHTSSIIHHEWNSYLMTLKRSEAPVTHQTLSCWWIKNGIKWASLLTLTRSLSHDLYGHSMCFLLLRFSTFLLHALSLSLNVPPEKMLYFYSNSFFRTHIFLLIERLWSSLIFGSVYSGRVSWVLSR